MRRRGGDVGSFAKDSHYVARREGEKIALHDFPSLGMHPTYPEREKRKEECVCV